MPVSLSRPNQGSEPRQRWRALSRQQRRLPQYESAGTPRNPQDRQGPHDSSDRCHRAEDHRTDPISGQSEQQFRRSRLTCRQSASFLCRSLGNRSVSTDDRSGFRQLTGTESEPGGDIRLFRVPVGQHIFHPVTIRITEVNHAVCSCSLIDRSPVLLWYYSPSFPS